MLLTTVLLLLTSTSLGTPLPQSHKPNGITVAKVDELGSVTASNTFTVRDGGGVGMIDDTVVVSYGDTLYAYDNLTAIPGALVSSSIAIADPSDPTKVDFKLNGKFPAQFGPVEAKWGEHEAVDAMGTSAIAPTGTKGEGVVFVVKNHRPGGHNTIIGGAPARVNMVDGYPNATRLMEYYWDGKTEPMYGTLNVVRATTIDDEWIYAFGPCGYGGCNGSINIYAARVKPNQAFDMSAYQYWNGAGWQSERLINPGSKEAVESCWGVANAAIFWNDFYSKWMMVFSDDWVDNRIYAKLADNIMGPWSASTLLYQATPPDTPGFHNAYATSVNSMYDPSKQTIIVTYTMAPNDVQAIRVHFS